MKKLTILLLCLLLLTGCAQTYDGPTVETPMLTEYYVHQTTTLLEQTFTWEYRRTYAYDIYGNLAREMYYRDGELEDVSYYRYDERGNQISQVRWDHTGLIPLPDSRRTYTYDDQNRLLTSVYCDGWGRETSRSSYTYDDVDHIKTWENGEGDQTIYYCDENWQELRTVSSSGYETVYSYDERGNQIGWVSYENGVAGDRCEARYDEQDRQIYGARYDANGVLQSETTYTYDDEANTMTIHRPDGDTRVEYYRKDGQYSLIEDYNEKGELTMYQQYTYRDILVPAQREE